MNKIFKKEVGAGMALEAALALPLFLFFIVNMIYVVEIIRLQNRIGSALHQVGNQAAYYAYYYRYGLGEETGGSGSGGSGISSALVSGILSQTYVRSKVNELAGEEYLNHSPLKGGSGSISYLRSSMLSGSGSNRDIISLVADYRAGPLIPWLSYSDFSLQNRYYGHAFTGYTFGSESGSSGGEEGEEEVMVYVTETGSVYHVSYDCTYLNLSVSAVDYSQLSYLRNTGGAKYYPCEICRPSAGGTVLITEDGNRYHSSRQCSGLKRTVRQIPLSEAEKMYGRCSRCGGSH